MAKIATKKTNTNKSKVTTKAPKVEMNMSAVESMAPILSPTPSAMPKMSSRNLSLALVVLGIALLTYKVGPYFVPALVNGMPVTRFSLWNRLEKSYGTQSLDDLVNEKILDVAIQKSGIKVEQAKIDEQMKNLEVQFKDMGGLDEALKQRGMTRADLLKQVTTQLSVEEILKDKITPTDEEIQAQYEAGAKTTYKDKQLDEVKDSVVEELKQTKLRESFLSWFEGVKKDAKVKNFGL